MNLLYVWNERYSREQQNTGYLLSSRYQITFAEQEGVLSICRRESLSEGGFWGKHIYDVMAAVGGNGAGKTWLAYYIMATLEEAGDRKGPVLDTQSSRVPFLLVFEDICEGEPIIKSFYAGPRELSVKTALRCAQDLLWKDLERFKFAYFTDTLSPYDYNRGRYSVISDHSLGGGIRGAFTRNLEMHYINDGISPILNYFDDEMEKILEFVCFHRDQNRDQIGIDFTLPKTVTVSAKRYETNLGYIADELERMGKTDGKDILRGKCLEIQQAYGYNICSLLAIHLMLNLFKDSCIPQTSSEHLEEQAERFLKEIDGLKCKDETAFDMILRLLERLEPTDRLNKLLPYRKMLLWLKKQPALQSLKRYWENWTLDLLEDQRTVKETIKELLFHYRATSFPFPYLAVSFGLSTGEYALLRRFVQINELLDHRSNGQAYVTNNLNYRVKCCGLMLFFDEADQSMHPEWQRKQLDWLLQFISERFKTCSSQLVIATHSPIVLSDMPRDHVLYLQNKEDVIRAEQRETRTFGSNIHTLFRNAFFLRGGTMGAFAERKINELARALQSPDGQVPPETERLIEEIGDDVIRNKLRQMRGESASVPHPRPTDRLAVEETICLLRDQIKQLEADVRELERMQHD